MRSVSDNKGITLIVLIITIIVLLIIAGISINMGINGISEVDDNRLISELEKVQHAITERYTKYQLTKDNALLVGTKIDLDDLTDVPDSISWKVLQVTTASETSTHPERKYYRLSKSDLNNLGLTGDYQGSSYIVNYYSGEVYDEGERQISNGDVLYKTATENEASELGDEIIKEGLQVWYDAINNTGSGHSNNTTVWKDLSGNGNNAELNGFNGTATSGWNSNYLAFDGANDWAKTVKEIDYQNKGELTIEFVDINGKLLDNNRENNVSGMIFESSSNWNNNDLAYGLNTNEIDINHNLRFTFHAGNSRFNIKKTTNNILDNHYFNLYTITLNTTNEYDGYININKNGELLSIYTYATFATDISNKKLKNYLLYIGSRNGELAFCKMNLADFKVYNKALNANEIKHNYILDKARYGIEE